MPHPTDIHVGRKVREARAAKGMSQEQLGKLLGVSFQQVQKYEKGTNRIGGSRLWDISQAVECPVSYFFEGLEDGGTGSFKPAPRRTIELAGRIEAIHSVAVRKQVLGLIQACSGSSQITAH